LSPIVLELENVYIDGEKTDDIQLVIYDGAVRGEFKKGLRLHIKGKLVNLVKDGVKTPSIAVVDGFNIELERSGPGCLIFRLNLRKRRMADKPSVVYPKSLLTTKNTKFTKEF